MASIAGEEDKSSKKTCIRSSLEPDVTIVVGGKEYQEYGQTLTCWSNYFDRALSIGMIEEQTRKFEFPDRDPKEWEWIVALMSPASEEKVTMKTLSIALDWFDFLCSDLGLQLCDNVLHSDLNLPILKAVPVEVKTTGWYTTRFITKIPVAKAEDFPTVMTHFERAVKYNLQKSKSLCFQIIQYALVNQTSLSLLSSESLKRIISLVKDNVECHRALMGTLRRHLPSNFSGEQAGLLLQNDMLFDIIIKEMAVKRAKELIDKSGDYEIKETFWKDNIWGKLVPFSWRKKVASRYMEEE